MDILQDKFGGLVPRLFSRDLPEGAAEEALNVDLRKGKIQPLKDLGPSLGAGGDSIYLDDDTWRSWDDDTFVVKSPVSDTRIITMDGTLPKIIDGSAGLEYELGIPEPGNKPTVAAAAKIADVLDITWYSFYEEPSGLQVDFDVWPISPVATVPGKTYTLASAQVPPRVTATPSARFIMWGYLEDDDGNPLGVLYPQPSIRAGSSTAKYEDSALSAIQTTSGDRVFDITYSSTTDAEFAVTRRYVMTYLRRWDDLGGDEGDDEGPPSSLSSKVTVDPTQNCELTNIPAPPAGHGVTHLRIYRTETGESGETEYFYVDEIAAGVTSYTDEKAGSEVVLNSILDTDGWGTPFDNLKGVQYHPGGFLVAYRGKYLHCSKPYAPHLWRKDFYPVDDRIRALGVVDQSVAVLTKAQPVWFTGNAPEVMSPDRVRINLACSSRTGAISTSAAVVYVSPRGLIELSPSSVNYLSDPMYTGKQWEDLNPGSIKLAYQDRQLFMFTDSGTKILRTDNGAFELTETEDVVTAAHVDPESDTLYVSTGGDIKEWAAGSDREYTYLGGIRLGVKISEAAVLRVSMSEDPVSFSIIADNVEVYTRDLTVWDNTYIWLPALPRAKRWQLKFVGTATIYDVALLEKMP